MSAAVTKTKALFLDRQAVTKAIGRAAAKALGKAGAYIRQSARQSIRTAKTASRPGRPPHSHVGTLKRLLFFSFDPATNSVVVGPVGFDGRQAETNVPKALEFGANRRAVANRRSPRPAIGKKAIVKIGGRASAGTTIKRNTTRGAVGVTYATIYTARQAARASALTISLYGPHDIPAGAMAARPFMGPALEKNRPKLPELWANTITP
jgi:hypothetical protein